MSNEFIWVERFRPKTIDDCILPDRIKTLFKNFVKKKDFPNLILSGSSGVGKTTIAKCLVEELDASYMFINGSLYRNLDTLRIEIMQYASSVSLNGNRKYVIIDEADYLNALSTQPALRNFMEEFSSNCGFIFTCNYPGRIIKELHSRCTNIKFDLTKQDFKELGTKFYVAVQAILDQEKIEYEKPVLAQVINKYYPDFRKVINELQAYSSNGKIDSGILSQSVASNLQELVALIKNKDYDGMTEFILTVQPDNAELIKFLFAAKNQFLDKKLWPDLILILNEGQKNDAVVLDKQVNNLAILTEIMVSLK